MARIYSTTDIKNNIPHRFPMRFIEKVIENGNKVTGFFRDIVLNDPIFRHQDRNLFYFEGIEACAQAAAYYALKQANENGEKHAILFKTMENLVIHQEGTNPLALAKAQYEATIEEDYAIIRIYDKDNTYLEGKIACEVVSKEKFARLMKIMQKRAPYPKDAIIISIFPLFSNADNIIICNYEHRCFVHTLVRLTDENPITHGHFNDGSIMPAIYEIFGADQSIRKTFGAEKLIEIEYFEFVAPIIPPSRIEYFIKYNTNGKFSVEVKSNDMLAAKGILRYDYNLITEGSGE